MRTITFQVTGHATDTDAPTVDDLLDQLRDYFDILKGVEKAVAENGIVEIEWRIINASKTSPLAIEAAPFARRYAMNIDRRAEVVVANTARGMSLLQTGGERPPVFTETVLTKAERLFERVTNGLSETVVDYGPDLPSMKLTRGNAYTAAAHVQQILKPPAKVYTEIGSVEGIAHGFDRDSRGYPYLKFKYRLTGEEINCRLFGQALQEIETRQIRDLLKNCRVQLTGTIYFKALGRISRMDADTVRFLRSSSELPDVDDILDENFTGGLGSEEYLERICDGDLS